MGASRRGSSAKPDDMNSTGSRNGLIAFLVAIGWLATIGVGTACAQVEAREIRWTHPAPASIASFKIVVSPAPKIRATTAYLDVGLPLEGSGIYSVQLPIDAYSYVAVVAVGNNNVESLLSNWMLAKGGVFGKPAPPAPSGSRP